jgi:hypothetical protein
MDPHLHLQLRIAGGVLVALALLHGFFPRWFRWRSELGALSPINRQMLVVHAFFIALMLLLMGALCLACTDDLVATPLGRRVCGGLGVFWSARLLIQFVGYSPGLWRGKRFETAVHIGCVALWSWLAALFTAAAGALG